MPHGLNSSGFGGNPSNKLSLFSRGLSLGTKYQTKGGADSDSSDDVDEKDEDGNPKNGRSSRSSQDDNTPVHPQKTTYITVENNSGELEQLKVLVDETAFGTTTPILQYLTEKGEINLAPDGSSQLVSGDSQLVPPNSNFEDSIEAPGKFKIPRRGLSRGSSMFNVLQKMTGSQFGTPTHHNFQNNKNVAFGELKTLDSDSNCFDLEKRGEHFRIEQHRRGGRSDSVLITPNLIKNLQKNRKRIIAKGGTCNIQLKNVHKKKRQQFKDIFTTAIDMDWDTTVVVFGGAFFVSWIVFAAIYYLISYIRGDFDAQNLPEGEAQLNGTWVPCFYQFHDFTSSYLYSLETQHTIGYGGRQTTEKCPEAIIFVSLQSIWAVVLEACMAGIIFAKLSRPENRANTIVFSKNAVVTIRNGTLFLLFRVGNMRKSFLIEAHIRAQVIHYKRTSKEGETVTYDTEEIKVNTERILRESNVEYDSNGSEISESSGEEGEGDDTTLLLWPCTVAHKIDKHSPFYNMQPRDFLSAKFEVIVSLEGVVEPTGNSVQARSSYLPNEILWGYRFKNLMKYNKSRGIYTVDCSNLNAVIQDETPLVSAKMLDEKRRLDAKRFATVRKKISAISRAASVRLPNNAGNSKNFVINGSFNHQKNNSDSEDSDDTNVTGINAPKVTITLGSEDGSLKNGSRRGSIARQVARDLGDSQEDSHGAILIPNTNSTSETIIE